MRLAVFASGRGGNLRNIYEQITLGTLSGVELALVISNNSRSGAIEFAIEKGITSHHQSLAVVGNDPERLAESHLDALRTEGIDFIALAGYLKSIPIPVLTAYSDRILNIHPSLLPAFGGAGMYGMKVHEAVIARGCKVSGATVHFVTQEYDAGPILMQQSCPVEESDTAETLSERIWEIERTIYPEALRLVASGQVQIAGSRTFLDS